MAPLKEQLSRPLPLKGSLTLRGRASIATNGGFTQWPGNCLMTSSRAVMDGAGTHFERGVRRKIASRDGRSSSVAWFFVLLLVGGITGTVILLPTSDVDRLAPGSVETALTFGSEPAHVRSGYDPAAVSREAPLTADLAQRCRRSWLR